MRRTRRLVRLGKGILALDTTPEALAPRLLAAGLEPRPEVAAAFRRVVLETPGLADPVGGVVLGPEEFAPDAGSAVDLLRSAGIVAGIRADAGFEPLTTDARERVTTGLDGLAARLERFADRGAGFAVWSTTADGAERPATMRALTTDAQAAARFAAICQDVGLVPLLRVGTRRGTPGGMPASAQLMVLLNLVARMAEVDVDLGAAVVATAPGLDAHGRPSAAGLVPVLPSALGGVAVTRGDGLGAHEGLATVRSAGAPWPVTVYLGREVTEPALQLWRGRAFGVDPARRALRRRLSAARAPHPNAHPIATAPAGQPRLRTVPSNV